MNREDKTLTLLDEIGEIDDIYLKEALSYKRKRPARAIWIPLIAACLALCLMATMLLSLTVMIPLGIVVLGNRFDILGGMSQDISPELNNDPSIETEAIGEKETEEDTVAELEPDHPADEGLITLDSLFKNSDEREYAKVDSAEKLSYNEASIIWQDPESGELFVETLSTAELESIKRNLGKGSHVGESSPKITYRVWIVDENRSVISPYLEAGVGNEGFAIFDYEAEIIPDEELIECISDILK